MTVVTLQTHRDTEKNKTDIWKNGNKVKIFIGIWDDKWSNKVHKNMNSKGKIPVYGITPSRGDKMNDKVACERRKYSHSQF